MSEPAPDPCELTARYFDGEAGADEDRALDHLASCRRCQRELGDLIGVDVALTRTGAAVVAEPPPVGPPPVSPPPDHDAPTAGAPIPITRRARRWPALVAGGLFAAAAAAALYLATRPRPHPAAPAVVLALGPERGVEARFAARDFDRHRPFATTRAASAAETIALDQLAALDRAGAVDALIAAHAVSGDLRRATALMTSRPAGPARDVDAAALALVAGAPDRALAAADRALTAMPGLGAARWNRALALRDLGFVAVAAAELDRVASAGEPGWADEARARAAALRAPMAERLAAMARFTAAAEAMVGGGAPLGAADVAGRPGMTRAYFLDAVRASTTPAELSRLEALAGALDAQAGTAHAHAALTRALAVEPRVWTPLATAYRALALRQAPISQAADLIARARRAGPAGDDHRLGGLLLSGRLRDELAWVDARATRTADPWLALLVAHERAADLIARGSFDRAEVELRTVLATCDGARWGHRCAQLALDLGDLLGRQSRFSEAAGFVERAMRGYAATGAVALEDYALSFLAEVERARGRLAVASAAFAEVLGRAPARDCDTRRYAELGLVLLASAGALPAGPPIEDCGPTPTPVELIAVVDRARASRDADDAATAQAWLERARRDGEPAGRPAVDAIAAVAADRDTPEVVAALRGLAAAEEELAAVRAWGYGRLIQQRAGAGRWADAAALVADELAVATPTRCALVASVDQRVGALVVLDADGRATGATLAVPSIEAWATTALAAPAQLAPLAACPQVTVLARPPLHGRADLLPPTMAWSFVGAAHPSAAPTAAPPRTLVVGDARPPAALALPTLAPPTAPADATVLRAASATPGQVLDALAGATYAELHVHGQLDPTVADGAFLALTPGADQRWALTATDVRARRLTAAPVVVLAACRAATVAPFLHARWSLPDAFLAAGARAVIAPTVEIPDAEAGPFFAAIRARITAGATPAAAVAAVRADAIGRGQAWAAGVVVFE